MTIIGSRPHRRTPLRGHPLGRPLVDVLEDRLRPGRRLPLDLRDGGVDLGPEPRGQLPFERVVDKPAGGQVPAHPVDRVGGAAFLKGVGVHVAGWVIGRVVRPHPVRARFD
jgi:hypothetical protein